MIDFFFGSILQALAPVGLAAAMGAPIADEAWAVLTMQPPLRQKSNQEAVAASWRRRTVSVARMTVELPVDPDRAQVELRDASKKQVDEAKAAKLFWEGVLFRFAFAEYAEDVDVDLARAADAAIANIQKTQGVTELRVTRKPLEMGGIPAIRMEMSYKFKESANSYCILIAGKENRLWQASAMYSTSSKDGEDLAKRVLDSIKLESG